MGIPLNIDWRQIFLHMFNLIILAGGLYFLLYHPVKKFIQEREEYYRGMEREAREALAAACASQEKEKLLLESVDRELREKRREAEAQLDSYFSARVREANEKADKILADARKSAVRQKQEITDSAKKDLLAIAKGITAKMVYSSPEEVYGRFLDIVEEEK